MEASKKQVVQTFGRKKTAIAVSAVSKGKGLVKINGSPIEVIQPMILRHKLWEPILLVGAGKFQNIDIRVKVRGGGTVAKIYAARQAIAKGLIAYYQKYVDEAQKKELKEILTGYDRSLLVADPRRAEAKKYGGRGARARIQKSYR
eukprot:TRINITY_DN19616_c0_g1_i1.p2 TRINITY_DN19616_c0_g1~~TRINITY_DN19616_c0_g1_i1.p2  ORF type:complete len:159 (+),score=35.23 TRINITY_DN19616_c0_g1_i1:42-479(+)